MMKYKKYLAPLLITAVTAVAVVLIVSNPPHSQRGRPAKAATMSVQVMTLAPEQYQISLDSFGTVKPRTQSVLVAQVSGQIIGISDDFRDGGFFEQGDVLVTIDDRDYQAGLKVAKAGVLSAEQQLLEEQARAKQALEDWQRLGNGEPASALVLHEPQLAAAKAQLLSAQAKLEQAQLALERTKIVAPYSGRILKKRVDVGQVIANNSQLADIYATDYVEIRLPINNNDLAFISLPEQYRESQQANDEQGANPVSFSSTLLQQQHWLGQVVRTEGSIDDQAQQLYVVAQINDPFAKHDDSRMSIKIGQYLDAKIQGRTIDNALVIPNSAIYQGSYVFIVDNGVLLRKDIELAWQNDQQAIVAAGLEFGQRLVLTPLGQVSSGTKVQVVKDRGAASTELAADSQQGVQR